MKNPNERHHLQEATVDLASALGAIESARYFSDGGTDNSYAMLVKRATELCEDIGGMLESETERVIASGWAVMEGARA